MSYRLTQTADEDIVRILRDTLDLFGPLQVEAYAALIERGLEVVGEDPFAPGSMPRDDLGTDIRSIHLQVTAQRRGAASHALYFTPPTRETGSPTIILRILHDRMDPKRHAIRSPTIDDGSAEL